MPTNQNTTMFAIFEKGYKSQALSDGFNADIVDGLIEAINIKNVDIKRYVEFKDLLNNEFIVEAIKNKDYLK